MLRLSKEFRSELLGELLLFCARWTPQLGVRPMLVPKPTGRRYSVVMGTRTPLSLTLVAALLACDGPVVPLGPGPAHSEEPEDVFDCRGPVSVEFWAPEETAYTRDTGLVASAGSFATVFGRDLLVFGSGPEPSGTPIDGWIWALADGPNGLQVLVSQPADREHDALEVREDVHTGMPAVVRRALVPRHTLERAAVHENAPIMAVREADAPVLRLLGPGWEWSTGDEAWLRPRLFAAAGFIGARSEEGFLLRTFDFATGAAGPAWSAPSCRREFSHRDWDFDVARRGEGAYLASTCTDALRLERRSAVDGSILTTRRWPGAQRAEARIAGNSRGPIIFARWGTDEPSPTVHVLDPITLEDLRDPVEIAWTRSWRDIDRPRDFSVAADAREPRRIAVSVRQVVGHGSAWIEVARANLCANP